MDDRSRGAARVKLPWVRRRKYEALVLLSAELVRDKVRLEDRQEGYSTMEGYLLSQGIEQVTRTWDSEWGFTYETVAAEMMFCGYCNRMHPPAGRFSGIPWYSCPKTPRGYVYITDGGEK